MTLKDEMLSITNKTKKAKIDKEQKDSEIATAKAREAGRRDAKNIIEKLPLRIKKAAKNGESSVYEWCYSDSEHGSFKLGFIASWARKQGFKTEFKYDREPANEGGDPWRSVTISWE